MAFCARVKKFHFSVWNIKKNVKLLSSSAVGMQYNIIISINFRSLMTRLWTPKYARIKLCHAILSTLDACIDPYLADYLSKHIIAILIAIYFGVRRAENDMKIASFANEASNKTCKAKNVASFKGAGITKLPGEKSRKRWWNFTKIFQTICSILSDVFFAVRMW